MHYSRTIETKESLSGVKVVCGSEITYSDSDGNFIIKSEKDTNELYFFYNTYETDTLKFILDNDKFKRLSE